MLRPSKITGCFISRFIFAKSGSRNSFHSVTTSSASARIERVIRMPRVVDAPAEDPLRGLARLGIERTHLRAAREQALR